MVVFASQPPGCCTGELHSPPSSAFHQVGLPSSAPALLEYGVNRLSIVDDGEEHASHTAIPCQSISNSTHLQNGLECEGEGERKTSSHQSSDSDSDGDCDILIPENKCQESQKKYCEEKNAVYYGIESAGNMMELGNYEGSFVVQVQGTLSLNDARGRDATKPLLCTRSKEDAFSPGNKGSIIPAANCSQNSGSLFSDNESRNSPDYNIEEHRQSCSISSSSIAETKGKDQSFTKFGVYDKAVGDVESEPIEEEDRIFFPNTKFHVKPQDETECITTTLLYNECAHLPSNNTSNNIDTTETDTIVPVELGHDSIPESQDSQEMTGPGSAKQKPCTDCDSDPNFENPETPAEENVKNDFSQEYIAPISNESLECRNIVNTEEHDYYHYHSVTTESNVNEGVHTQSDSNVVTPQICASQYEVALFENNNQLDQDCEISFSPLCNENERGWSKAQECGTPNSQENKIGICYDYEKTDSASCQATELYSSQHERSESTEYVTNNSVTKSKEMGMLDMMSTQPFSAISHKAASMERRPNDNRCSVNPPENVEHEITFSPLFTQVYNGRDEFLNHKDSKASSQVPYGVIHFSPLKSCHLGPSLEDHDIISIDGLQTKPGESFQNGQSVEEDDQVVGAHGKSHETKTDHCYRDLKLPLSEEIEKDTRNSILSKSNHTSNVDINNSTSNEAIPNLEVFSPLVTTAYKIDDVEAQDCADEVSKTSPQEEHRKFNSDSEINQRVPNFVGDRIQCIKETFVKDEENESKQCKEKINESYINQKQIEENSFEEEKCRPKLALDNESRKEIEPVEQNEYEKKPIQTGFILKTHNGDDILPEGKHHNTAQNTILDKERFGGRDNQPVCDSMFGEQVVPGNDILIKDDKGCLDQSSLYDVKSTTKEEDRKRASVLTESHQSSFEWKSLHRAVLVGSRTDAQHTLTDHLESITPLPHPSQLKRPRTLRVGLSKKQKVRPLHEKQQ